VRPGIRWPVSYGHPKCRESATYVPGPGRCEPPDGKRRSNSEPGCGWKSRGVRGNLADRIRGEKKIFCCVTTRGCNVRVLKGLGRGLGALTALLFSLGMLGFDAGILTTFGLPAGRLPAADPPQALWGLAIALVPAPGLVLAATAFAQADPQTWSAPSGRTAVLSRTLTSAHGRCFLPRESSGRMREHSLRALSKLEPALACQFIVLSKTRQRDKRSHRRAGNKARTEALPFKRSSSPEQDRKINGLIDALGTRTQRAAVQTIESAAGSGIGPTGG
jgi:hypothetical protein